MVVADFYTNGEYLQKNPGWHVNAAPWKAGSVLQIIKRNALSPRSVCEIGCGAGEILRILQQNLASDATFVGYDIAPQAIELAKQRENERLHCYLADYFEEEHEYVDLLLFIDVLEHFENMFQVLYAVKAQSQYKILQLPLDLSVLSIFGNKLPEYRQATGHLHFFTKDIALAVLRDAGYEVLDVFYCRQPIDTEPWNIKRPARALRKMLKIVKHSMLRMPANLCYALRPDFAVRFFGGWRLMVLLQ